MMGSKVVQNHLSSRVIEAERSLLERESIKCFSKRSVSVEGFEGQKVER